jgi:hypothetical protein
VRVKVLVKIFVSFNNPQITKAHLSLNFDKFGVPNNYINRYRYFALQRATLPQPARKNNKSGPLIGRGGARQNKFKYVSRNFRDHIVCY